MPTVYKYKSKRVKRVRRTRRKRVPTNKALSTRIKKLEHQEEMKYIDIQNSTAPIVSSGGVPLVLSVIAQGDDINQRVGEEVTLHSLRCDIILRHIATTTTSLYRMLIFYDLQTNGIGFVPFVSALGGAANTGLIDDTTITSLFNAPLNYRTKDRYRVLYDKVFVINPASSAVDSNIHIRKFIRLSNAKHKYSSSAGSIAAIPSRSICYFLFGSGATDTQVSTFRLMYTDS